MHKKNLLTALLVVLAFSLARSAQATIVQTNSEYIGSATNPPLPIVTDFSHSLVLQGSPTLASSSFSSYFVPFSGSSPAVLNNGVVGGPQDSSQDAVSNGTPNGQWLLTYNLNTSVNSKGYDISQITAITRWTTDYLDQDYKIYYATTSHPTLTLLGEFTAAHTDPNFELASLQSSLTDTTGTLLSHVTQLEFAFQPSIGGNYPAYSEIGVFGTASTPEPASLILFGLGAIGLFVAARRRKT